MSTGKDGNEERGEGDSGPGPPNNDRSRQRPDGTSRRVVTRGASPAGVGALLAASGDDDNIAKRRRAQSAAEFNSTTSTIYASVPVGTDEDGNALGRADPHPVLGPLHDPPPPGDAPVNSTGGKRRPDSWMESEAKRQSSQRRIGPLPPPPALPTLPRVAPTFPTNSSRSRNGSIIDANSAAVHGSNLEALRGASIPVRGFNYQTHSLLAGIPPALIAQMGASLAAANSVSASTLALQRAMLQQQAQAPAPTSLSQILGGASGSHTGIQESLAAGSHGSAPQPSLDTLRSQPLATATPSILNPSGLPLFPMHYPFDPMSVALAAQRHVSAGVGLSTHTPNAAGGVAGAPAAGTTAAGPNLSHGQSYPLLMVLGRSPVTGRPAVPLSMTCDEDALSAYQCLVRKQIELFEASTLDVDSNAQGRNRPIVLGQVGIRCRHCSHLPPRERTRGATYYPAQLQGLYQACQNLSLTHLAAHCQHIPSEIRAELDQLRKRKSSAGGGKKYWADAARVLGVYEDGDGLRFTPR